MDMQSFGPEVCGITRKSLIMKRLSDDLVRQALSDEDYEDYQRIAGRVAKNSRAIPTQIASGVGLSDMLGEMVRSIEPRLELAKAEAIKDRREKPATEMPWVHKASAKSILQDIERLEWYNNRIVAFAAEVTARYTIIGEMLKTHRLAAMSVMQREDEELGKALITFLRRLKREGLKAESVKDLPRGVVAALVALLNGETKTNLAGALGLETLDSDSLDGLSLDEQQDALDRQIAALKVELETFTAYRDLCAVIGEEQPVAPDPDKWDYAAGPLPRAFWPHILGTVDYDFDDRKATDAERDAMRAMPLPVSHDWSTLREQDSDFAAIAFNTLRVRRGAENNVKDFLGPRLGIEPESLDQNTIRAWLFLLAARHMDHEASNAFFGERYFDGVMLPLDDAQPGRVRVLRWALDE